MRAKVDLAALLIITILLGYSTQRLSAEEQPQYKLSATHQQLIDKAVKELSKEKKLSIKKTPKGGPTTYANIVDLSPCNASVPGGNVTIEMATELYAGQSETESVLFLQYLLCVDESESKVILKQVNSVLLGPGVGACGFPSAELHNLHSGYYGIVGLVKTRNPDGTETLRATKLCRISVP